MQTDWSFEAEPCICKGIDQPKTHNQTKQKASRENEREQTTKCQQKEYKQVDDTSVTSSQVNNTLREQLSTLERTTNVLSPMSFFGSVEKLPVFYIFVL